MRRVAPRFPRCACSKGGFSSVRLLPPDAPRLLVPVHGWPMLWRCYLILTFAPMFTKRRCVCVPEAWFARNLSAGRVHGAYAVPIPLLAPRPKPAAAWPTRRRRWPGRSRNRQPSFVVRRDCGHVTQGHFVAVLVNGASMGLETVCIDDDRGALVTPRRGLEPVDSENGVWMRSCPQCNGVLCKSSPNQTLRCVCGWEWQS